MPLSQGSTKSQRMIHPCYFNQDQNRKKKDVTGNLHPESAMGFQRLMHLFAQPQTSRNKRTEVVREEVCDLCQLELTAMPHWHGKLKLLGRIKLMDIRNFTLLMLFSSFTATLIELASIILKYFSNMNGRGKEKVIKNNGQRTSYLPDEACTALNSYQLCPGCFHLPGTQEQSVITSTHRLTK